MENVDTVRVTACLRDALYAAYGHPVAFVMIVNNTDEQAINCYTNAPDRESMAAFVTGAAQCITQIGDRAVLLHEPMVGHA